MGESIFYLWREDIDFTKLKKENRAFKTEKYEHSYISEPLIFEHTLSESNVFRIPLTINPQENIKINWGDGIVEKIENKDDICLLHCVIIHNYTNTRVWKKYRISISGSKYSLNHIGYCQEWANGITNFVTLGDIGITDLSGLFYYCNEFNGIISENFNTSKVTNMNSMFCGAESFNQPLEFDTSRVTDMGYMFYEASSFNQSLGDKFDTSMVTDMCYMFSNASSFNQSLGDKFNTSMVTNMSCMFHNAKSFNQSLEFDTSMVTDMGYMFCNAECFNQYLEFDTSSVTNMSYMFSNAISFNKDLNWIPKY